MKDLREIKWVPKYGKIQTNVSVGEVIFNREKDRYEMITSIDKQGIIKTCIVSNKVNTIEPNKFTG